MDESEPKAIIAPSSLNNPRPTWDRNPRAYATVGYPTEEDLVYDEETLKAMANGTDFTWDDETKSLLRVRR